MEQKKLKEGRLLDYNGNLVESGYSTSLIKNYRRKDIVGLKTRIKEWDYYAFLNEEYGLCFTISDCSMFSLISFTLLDFKNKTYKTMTKLKPFTFGKTNLPSSSEVGDILYKDKTCSMSFLNDGKTREIKCNIKKFIDNKNFEAHLIINTTSFNSLVIATPFNKKKHFYYNQKINNLIGNGYFKIGDQLVSLKECLGVLDRGRGVWTYKNTWYWSSLSAKINNDYVGFNLGYGFGNNKNATENMLFINNKSYKLDDVIFEFKKDEDNKDIFDKDVKVYSKSKDIDLIFTPIIDRNDDTNALIIASYQHQLFGYFNGTIKTNDNQIIEFKNSFGFLEKVINRW